MFTPYLLGNLISVRKQCFYSGYASVVNLHWQLICYKYAVYTSFYFYSNDVRRNWHLFMVLFSCCGRLWSNCGFHLAGFSSFLEQKNNSWELFLINGQKFKNKSVKFKKKNNQAYFTVTATTIITVGNKSHHRTNRPPEPQTQDLQCTDRK